MTLVAKSAHPFNFKEIAEFQSATIMQFPTVFIVLLWGLVIGLVFQERSKLAIGPALLAGGMTLLALAVVKFMPFAALTIGLLLAREWARRQTVPSDQQLQPGLRDALEKVSKFCRDLSPPLLSGISFLCICIMIKELTPLFSNKLSSSMVPKAAVDFMLSNNLPRPWLNEFGTGGYLMYRQSDNLGEPTHKVVIDGRTNVNSPQIWKMYLAALTGKDNWQEFLTHTKAQTVLWREGGPFPTLLKQSGVWCRVFNDQESEGGFAVYTRCKSDHT